MMMVRILEFELKAADLAGRRRNSFMSYFTYEYDYDFLGKAGIKFFFHYLAQ
jgi:hypothetical protein